MFGKTKMYPEQVIWIQKRLELKGSMSEADHYALTSASMNAKDYPNTIVLAKNYMSAYPDKPQPYTFLKRSSLAADPDTSKGIAIASLLYMDSVYASVSKEKYKKEILMNQGFIISTYGSLLNTMKRNPELKPPATVGAAPTEILQQFLVICQKGQDLANEILTAYPDPNDDYNKFATGAKAEFQKNIDYYSKPQTPTKKTGGSGGGGTSGKGK